MLKQKYVKCILPLFYEYHNCVALFVATASNAQKGTLLLRRHVVFDLNFSIAGVKSDDIDGHNDVRQERFGFHFGKTFKIGISKNAPYKLFFRN